MQYAHIYITTISFAADAENRFTDFAPRDYFAYAISLFNIIFFDDSFKDGLRSR